MRPPRNLNRLLLSLVATAFLVTGACKTVPDPQDVGDSAPDPGPSSADITSTESVDDPFGPSGSRRPDEGELDEMDLTADEMRSPAEAAALLESRLETVYFDFDRASLGEEARASLERNAAVLRELPELDILIEGHCDERGTVEYNLALGDRRANTVKEFLVQLGLSSSRFQTVSFGEERPVDPGHTEIAWSRNRRAEFHAR